MKHPINRPIRDVVNIQLRRMITLETRADARFHVSDLCCRHNTAVVSLRSIHQAASAANYATRLCNKRAIQHATTKYLTGTRFVRVSGRPATCIKQSSDRRRGSGAAAVHGVLISTSLSNAGIPIWAARRSQQPSAGGDTRFDRCPKNCTCLMNCSPLSSLSARRS